MTIKNLDWSNPEKVYFLWGFQNEELIRREIREKFPNISKENQNKLSILFSQYGHLYNHLKSLFDFGFGLHADKARWILIQYYNNLLGSHVEKIELGKKQSYPDFETTEFWISYVEILVSSFYTSLDVTALECMICVRKKSDELRKNYGYVVL